VRLVVYPAIAGVLFIVTLLSAVVIKEVRAIPRRLDINEETVFDSRLGHYDVRLKERKYIPIEVDQDGVPVVIMEGQKHHHPVRITQFALGAYEHFLETGDHAAKASFLKSATWLRNNLRKHGDFYYWEYTFRSYGHPGGEKVPWFSAMAQGQGASVLLRAFLTTGEKSYLEKARDAIEPTLHDLSVGGISVVRGSDYVFPQEYVTTRGPTQATLFDHGRRDVSDVFTKVRSRSIQHVSSD
jgi:hypothetical protein